MNRLACAIAFVLLCTIPASFAAGVPPLLDIQGELTDAGGAPYPDGIYSMAFRITSDTSGAGIPLWTETQPVKVEGGLFTVVLGLQTALSPTVFTSGSSRFLTITVGTEPPLPSIRLNSTAYSIQSVNADNATLALNLTCVACVGVGEIASGAVGSAEVLDNSLTSDDLAAGSVGNSEIAAGAVSTISIGDGAVLSVDLAENSVTAGKIAFNAVGSDEIAAGAVGTSEIALDAVDANRIAPGAVGSSELGLFAVTASRISPNAVSSTKISDEPGVAAAVSIPDQEIIGTGVDVLDSWTIDAPAAGHILVMATGWFINVDVLILSLSTAPGVLDSSRMWPLSGYGSFPLTMHALFPTDGGQETFYLLGAMNSPNDSASVRNLYFTLVYLPTAYGIVQLPNPGAMVLEPTGPQQPAVAGTAEINQGSTAPAPGAGELSQQRIADLERRLQNLESALLKQPIDQ